MLYFQFKIVSKIGRIRSAKQRVRDDDLIRGLSSDCLRIILGSLSNRLFLAETIQGFLVHMLNL